MPRRITLAIAVALAALLLSAGLVAAQDPPETATATHLEPGLNLVGWVGEATPVSQLFQQIPRLEAIWAWDAELRDWIVAAPGAPEWLGGLGRVTAGMGLRMQLGGDQPFAWQRSTEPTRGLVRLRTGWNLVAWSGADGTAIGDVVKGIGWSLRTVRRWDAANQQWSVWTSPERSAQVIANTGADQGDADDDAEMPGIRRGEALWIEVARAVNWLQPTEILPRLVFPGGASEELQARVREDVESVLAFFRNQYGIQADPDFTIYTAKDVDALIQAYKADGEEIDDSDAASLRAWWNRQGAWGGYEIVIKQSHWPEDLSTDEIPSVRYTITHEYFHVMQWQLLGSSASIWLTEGTASWVDDEHKVLEGERTWDDLRDVRLSAITNDTPTLRSAESDNAFWQYTLGWLAADQLIADAGLDSLIEVYRRFSPTEIGPHGRWESTSDWRTAFQQVSGQPVSEFYATFDAWQREQAAANPTTANSYDGNRIRGRVIDEEGGPVAGVFVNAIRVEGETGVGWNQRAETAADGTFAVRAPEDGDYRLSIDITDDCGRYYSDGELINDQAEAQPITVTGADVREIDFQLPPNVCGWQIRGRVEIRGRVVGPNGEPLVRLGITARPLGASGSTTSTALDGTFALPATKNEEHLVWLHLTEHCRPYYSPDWTTLANFARSRITVGDTDVNDVLIEVPAGLCEQRITGRMMLPDGQPLADKEIWISGGLGYHVSGLRTDNDGSFAVVVATDDEYELSFELEQDCRVYVDSDGFTERHWEYSGVRVEGQDAHLGLLQIPDRLCRRVTITGRFTTLDGQPYARKRIEVCRWTDAACERYSQAQTNDDGSFAVAVTTDGSYSLSIWSGGGKYPPYFSSDDFATDLWEGLIVPVKGSDVQLGTLRVHIG